MSTKGFIDIWGILARLVKWQARATGSNGHG